MRYINLRLTYRGRRISLYFGNDTKVVFTSLRPEGHRNDIQEYVQWPKGPFIATQLNSTELNSTA